MTPAAQQMQPDVQLEYAPGEALRRSRRVRRIAGAIVLLVLAALSIRYGPRMWWQARMMHAVWQARHYVAPPDQVVYADGPSTARTLVTWQLSSSAATAPAGLDQVAADPVSWSRLAPFLPGYGTLFTPRGSRPEPLLFLHEMRTPSGKPLIVATRLSGVTYYPVDGGTLACTYSHVLVQPNGWKPPAGAQMGRAWGGVDVSWAAASLHRANGPAPTDGPADPGPIKVLVGAPDPASASGFVVPYEVNGTRKRWRFHLTDAGLDLEEQVVR